MARGVPPRGCTSCRNWVFLSYATLPMRPINPWIALAKEGLTRTRHNQKHTNSQVLSERGRVSCI